MTVNKIIKPTYFFPTFYLEFISQFLLFLFHFFFLLVVRFQSLIGFLFLLVILGIVVDKVRSTCHKYHELYYRIIQQDHVLILGWNDKTLFLIRELCNMYENTKNPPNKSYMCVFIIQLDLLSKMLLQHVLHYDALPMFVALSYHM